jgi:hypothetical protein
MLYGSCLFGGVRFEIERAVGPFELCHSMRWSSLLQRRAVDTGKRENRNGKHRC